MFFFIICSSATTGHSCQQKATSTEMGNLGQSKEEEHCSVISREHTKPGMEDQHVHNVTQNFEAAKAHVAADISADGRHQRWHQRIQDDFSICGNCLDVENESLQHA